MYSEKRLDNRYTLPWKNLIVPAIVMAAFWSLAIVAWQSSGYTQPLFMFGYIGTSLGVGLGLYGTLPKKQKPIGRRLTLLLVGLFLVGFAILMGHENVQIEGFVFGLATGVIQMTVIHYLIAKIFGPLLFGRLWCGWACWTVMILDLLPFRRPSGRLPGRWGGLRYTLASAWHLFCCLSLSSVSVTARPARQP
jgi:ferredoxin-type protein NapH